QARCGLGEAFSDAGLVEELLGGQPEVPLEASMGAASWGPNAALRPGTTCSAAAGGEVEGGGAGVGRGTAEAGGAAVAVAAARAAIVEVVRMLAFRDARVVVGIRPVAAQITEL